MNQDKQEIFQKKHSHAFRNALLFGLVLLLMAACFQAGLLLADSSDKIKEKVSEEKLYLGKVTDLYSQPSDAKLGEDIDFKLFWKVWDTLKENYVDKANLNDKKMFYGALKGMVAAIGDPYTVFMDPKIAEDFSNDLAGTFEGIGAEIGLKDEIITIIAPLPDMPAEKAGLKSGDKILAIDGAPTTGLSVDEAVSKIRGPKDTNVVLSIYREGFDQVKDFTITRNKIVVKSIRTSINENKIFTIQITNFNDDTEKLFNEAVNKAVEANPKGIILDLRNNPGGYLDTSIEVASEWVEEGVIVTEKYSEDKKIEHLARGRARLKGIKTVVLVNQGSASASEIVSGALQDYKLAALIGMKTFGKGSVQTLTNLDDGSSIKITVAKWLTPNGNSINDNGIMPDYQVDLSREDYESGKDPETEAANKYLLGENIDEFLVKENKATSTEQKK